uniref:Uncharacterized protein n=1 Tax=Setaria italica TaxID=4555 RepID=K3YFG1_SETIT
MFLNWIMIVLHIDQTTHLTILYYLQSLIYDVLDKQNELVLVLAV